MRRRRPHDRRSLALCCFSAAMIGALAASQAEAQLLLKGLPQQEGVGIIEQRGASIPRELVFQNSFGKEVRIGDFFDGERPVILVMAYYTCPLLCTKVLNEVQKTLNMLNWTAGKEFRIVTVSFDHRNTTEQAREKQSLYLLGYDREVPESAWEFLTGDVRNIRALADAVGYHYKFLPDTKEFSHPAAMIFLTPDGRVHNYLERLDFPAMEVRLALAEAADGKVGTIFDRVVSFCFVYDHSQGKYTLAAKRVMALGGVASLAAVGTMVGLFAAARRRMAFRDQSDQRPFSAPVTGESLDAGDAPR